MTDAKDPKEGGSGAKAGQPASVAAAAPAVSPMTNPSGPRPAEREVQTREMQYMLGRRAPSALSPMAFHGQVGSYDAEQIVNALSNIPDVTIVRRIRQSSLTV